MNCYRKKYEFCHIMTLIFSSTTFLLISYNFLNKYKSTSAIVYQNIFSDLISLQKQFV